MGWYIDIIKNEVKINKKIAKELLNCGAQITYSWRYDEDMTDEECLDQILNGDRLNFNPDDMEHMDFIFEKEIQNVLKNNKVRGDICFYSNDGDNAGKAWGYRFDGNGSMVKLKGKLIWTPFNHNI